MTRERLLALDLGEHRVGIAIYSQGIVVSKDTITSQNRKDVMQKILEIVRAESIEKLILGLPKGNQKSEDIVRSFAIELNRLISIPIEFEDETLTSKEAERLLKNSKLKPKSDKYKLEVDKLSAKMILEQYLKNSLHRGA